MGFMESEKGNIPGNLKKMPFDVPDSYFSSLEDKLHERIGGHKPDGAWGLYWRSLKAYAGVAAAFLIVCGFGWCALKLTNKITGKQDFTGIAQEQEVDTDVLLDSLENIYYANVGIELSSNEEKLAAEVESADGENSAEMTLTDEEIEEYLIQTPTSFSSLLAEEISNIH